MRGRCGILGCLLAASVIQGQILVEEGSLSGFLAGDEAACAYDNWLSHVSENILRPGYNVYAPPGLDPQAQSFGHFERLYDTPEDRALLDAWHSLVTFLLLDEGSSADSLLQELDTDYRLVDFQDTDSGRPLWLLREPLDSSHVDLGLPGEADDVIGGFNRSWGLYVFSPTAERPEICVQVPHPCDDYIAPYVGLRVFQELDAGLLMIASAGREVLATGSTYTNSRSLSDPTRNCLHPFAVTHEAMVDFWQVQGTDELVLQLHSYDDASHRDLRSMVVTGGRYTRYFLPPLYDPGFGVLGALNLLAEPVQPADGLGFPHEQVSLLEYISGNPLFPLVVEPSPGQTLVLPTAGSLWGYNSNCQMLHTFGAGGQGYAECDEPERLLHIELDELPLPAHTLGESAFYQADTAGTRLAQFDTAWLYYAPFFEALRDAHDSLQVFTADPDPPEAAQDFRSVGLGSRSVSLRWTPTRSSSFESYEILADSTGAFGPSTFLIDRNDYEQLCWARCDRITLDNLGYRRNWVFCLRGRDELGRLSAHSDTVAVYTDDLEPPQLQALFPAHGRFWSAGTELAIDLRLRDEEHRVDLSSLQWRLDDNLDGVYNSPAEDWQDAGLAGSSADTTLRLVLPHNAIGDSLRFEVRVHDDQNPLFAYSGFSGLEGIQDDWFGSVDQAPPAAFGNWLDLEEDSTGGLALSWSAVEQDSTFRSVLLHFASQPFNAPEEAEFSVDRLQEPELAQAEMDEAQLAELPLEPGTLWLAAQAEDWAGNRGGLSGLLAFSYRGPYYCIVENLGLDLQGPLLQLSWASACSDPAVLLEGFSIHRLESPWEEATLANRIAFTQESFWTLPWEGEPRGFFQVQAHFLLPSMPSP